MKRILLQMTIAVLAFTQAGCTFARYSKLHVQVVDEQTKEAIPKAWVRTFYVKPMMDMTYQRKDWEKTDADGFACLDDPKEILSRARKFSKEKSTEIHVFERPPSLAASFGARLAVPVAPSLETIARRLIKSPEEFVRTKDAALNHLDKASRETVLERSRQWARADGVAALRYFKSKQNIALLTPLLNNPASMVFHGPGPDETKRVYYIRKAAYDVLRKWGVKITKPVIEEPLSSAELLIRQIQTGMTREQVEKILGPSRGETSTKIHYASWYLAKPELDPREFSVNDRPPGAIGVVFENGPDGIDTNATAKVRAVHYFAERRFTGGWVRPMLVVVSENAPEPHQTAARRLAQALNYRIIKGNWTHSMAPSQSGSKSRLQRERANLGTSS